MNPDLELAIEAQLADLTFQEPLAVLMLRLLSIEQEFGEEAAAEFLRRVKSLWINGRH